MSISKKEINFSDYILTTPLQRAFIVWCNSLLFQETASMKVDGFPQLKNFEIESYDKLSDPFVLLNIVDMLFIKANQSEWIRSRHDSWILHGSKVNVNKLNRNFSYNSGLVAKDSPAMQRAFQFKNEQNNLLEPRKQNSDLINRSKSSNSLFNSPSRLNTSLDKSQDSPMSISDSPINSDPQKSHSGWSHLLFILREFYVMKKLSCNLLRVLQALGHCRDIFYEQLNRNMEKRENFNSNHNYDSSLYIEDLSNAKNIAIAVSLIIYMIIGTIALFDESDIVESILNLDRTIMKNLHILMKSSMELFEISVGEEIESEEEDDRPTLEHIQNLRRTLSQSVLDRLERSFDSEFSKFGEFNDSFQKPPLLKASTSPSIPYSPISNFPSPSQSTIKISKSNEALRRENSISTIGNYLTMNNQLSPIKFNNESRRLSNFSHDSRDSRDLRDLRNITEIEDMVPPSPKYHSSKISSNKVEYLKRQKEDALAQEISLYEENKTLKDNLWDLNQKYQDLLREHEDLKETYDAAIDNVEIEVENRFNNQRANSLRSSDSKIVGRVFSTQNLDSYGARPLLSTLHSKSLQNVYNPREENLAITTSKYIETISELEHKIEMLQKKLNSTSENSIHQSTEISILKSRLKEKDEMSNEIKILRERCHELMKYRNESIILEERIQTLENDHLAQQNDVERFKKQRDREMNLTRTQLFDISERNQMLETENETLYKEVEELKHQLRMKEIASSSEPELVVTESDNVRFFSNEPIHTDDSRMNESIIENPNDSVDNSELPGLNLPKLNHSNFTNLTNETLPDFINQTVIPEFEELLEQKNEEMIVLNNISTELQELTQSHTNWEELKKIQVEKYKKKVNIDALFDEALNL